MCIIFKCVYRYEMILCCHQKDYSVITHEVRFLSFLFSMGISLGAGVGGKIKQYLSVGDAMRLQHPTTT